jgi:hypothetical protein
MSLDLPQGRYIAAMERQKARIEKGIKLTFYDDTTPGDKSTECSWGLCSEDKEAWPDAQDHLWPDQFLKDGRVAPKYPKKGNSCPLDARPTSKEFRRGCFFTCRVFNPVKGEKIPTREQAIQFYERRIGEFK